ncbi:MAG: DUF4349 domain-containing protein [Myxococcaceae bacterium]
MKIRSLVVVLLSLVCCSRAPEAVKRVVVRGAELRCETPTLDGLEAKVESTARELDGFLVKTHEADSGLELEVRVPSEKLDLALAALGGLGSRVDSREVHGEDFTEEYVDREGQLRNLTATRERLLALLERADKVDDALAVNRGLAEVQGELEKLQGRVKYLEQSAAMSTIAVSFHTGAAPWRPLEVAKDSAQVLLLIARVLANMLIVVAVFFPLWAPVVFFVRRRAKQTRAAAL